MSKPKWNKGAPPSIGWWPASRATNSNVIRWWDGKYWSDEAYPHASARIAAICASNKTAGQKEIEWTERWWL